MFPTINQFTFLLQIILLLPLLQVKCDSSSIKNGKKYEKLFLSGLKSIHSLRVSTEHYEPFMYRDKNGNFNNGIEYKLIKTIAEKEQLELSFVFVNHFRPLNLDEFIFKYFFLFQRKKVLKSNFIDFSVSLFKGTISLVILTF